MKAKKNPKEFKKSKPDYFERYFSKYTPVHPMYYDDDKIMKSHGKKIA